MPIRVLIIDDDPILTNIFKETLRRDKFEVLVAHSGRDGVEAARRLEPDVILLDLMMPEMDGWQVCQTIRTFSQVPILVLSAVINSEMVMRALQVGANDYMVKPAPPGVLISRLKKLTRQTRLNLSQNSLAS